jgi:hypothetical protein
MCDPIKESAAGNSIGLLCAQIVGEIHKARSCMFMEPEFTNNPDSNFLYATEANSKHSCEHMNAAISLTLKLHKINSENEAKLWGLNS